MRFAAGHERSSRSAAVARPPHGTAATASATSAFQTGWILAAIGLYAIVVVVAIALYAPALKQQIAEAELDPGSPVYAAAARRCNLFGVLTTAVLLVIVVLMVTKPF